MKQEARILGKQIIKDNSLKLLGYVALFFAMVSANSACTTFFYEPEQPAGLERLKKH